MLHLKPFNFNYTVGTGTQETMMSLKPFLSLLLPTAALALGQPRYVETLARPDSFPIAQAQACAAIYVDPADYPGVIRAAGDLQADIARVTNCTPTITHDPH